MQDKNLYAHRKAKSTLRIIDESGNPVANLRMNLRQTNHEFLFGCGAFDFISLTENSTQTAQSLNPHSDDLAETSQSQTKEEFMQFIKDRTEKWLALYNYGTLPFYWGQYETTEGNPSFESRNAAAKYLQEKGVTVKGHPLCWHTVCADWLMQYDNKTILDKQLKRIQRDVTAFRGLIDKWDVINEVVIMPIFDKYDNAITRICKEYGRVGLIKKVFEEAKAANPEAELLLNDFNTSSSYEILIDGCLNAGAPISTIGIQSHQHQGYWGAEKLHEILDRFSHFNLPIHFTENTLVSGFLIPPEIEDLNDFQVKEWPSTPEGEARQAKEVEEMYRILFAHPQVKAITGWDFADGAWLNAPSGVIRKDNSVKPVYNMLMNLIKDEWWTICEICTDENGYVQVEGFKGDYVIELPFRAGTLKLTDNLPEQTVVLKSHNRPSN